MPNVMMLMEYGNITDRGRCNTQHLAQFADLPPVTRKVCKQWWLLTCMIATKRCV